MPHTTANRHHHHGYNNNDNNNSDKYCDKESGVRKVVLRGSIRNVVMAQQLIMDLVWEEMETAIGVMQFMVPDEVNTTSFSFFCYL